MTTSIGARLRELGLPAVIDTSQFDIIADFFNPVLRRAQRYDRGVGFFSSGWLRLAADGMGAFAAAGGHARWITSPILDERDWTAIQSGAEARQDNALLDTLHRNIDQLVRDLHQDTLSALAWLVADGVITFRLAVPRFKLHGEFHDKFGCFTDAHGDQLAFHGSYNDSIQGTLNYESIHVYASWNDATQPYAQACSDRFERLWNNLDPNVEVFNIPEAARARILQLRTQARPYTFPKSSESRSITPQVPESLELRAYQEEAIAAWFANEGRGLLEMATGTGKTITALAASTRLLQRQGHLAVVISVPYQHLVDQWDKDAQAFGYRPVLAYQGRQRWQDEFNQQIVDFNSGSRPFLCVITTHATFSSEAFQTALARLTGPALVIADEVHHLGAAGRRHAYPHHIPFRLALSATPDRWFDELGTQVLKAYFGPTVFSFPLEQAIGVSLTPYYYYPHLVTLTDEEMDQYVDISAKIARVAGRKDDRGAEIMRMLLMKRANLLNDAQNKLDKLGELLDRQSILQHTLFYCSPGQIEDVLRLVGWEKGYAVHPFTAKEKVRDRAILLEQFARGELQGLVAMKCLDEGVDVPSTQTAFFLASTGNPREFIQRRGRVLRKYPGKEFSVLHDLIAVPPLALVPNATSPAFRAERSVVRRELERFKEFAGAALNKHQAIDQIWGIAKRYHLIDF